MNRKNIKGNSNPKIYRCCICGKFTAKMFGSDETCYKRNRDNAHPMCPKHYEEFTDMMSDTYAKRSVQRKQGTLPLVSCPGCIMKKPLPDGSLPQVAYVPGSIIELN